ncbi:MAG: amino acid ABC transporter permease [Rhodobacteraceae bacterium PARR1]|nr:MAG: amino acid ABC transporter permease [Rhodobacteraceae bacterium PARR1]
MALAHDAPKESFRLSMLIYDTRYRAITIQVFVLILVAAFFAWLLNNTIENLAIRGKEFNYGFLWQRAGYDIGQQLIPYTNDSTHFRALLIGLLNTLAVAVLGCIFATLLGVLIGVLRLSKNWLVSRLMTVYVEVFRNVPVLLWILLAYVVLSEVTPSPRDFKAAEGVEPAASMVLGGTVAITNRGTNIPAPLVDHSLGGFEIGGIPVNFTVLAFIAVMIASFWANARILTAARLKQEATGDRPTTWWKSLLVLFAPIIALSLVLGLHWDIPALAGFNFKGGILVAHSFTALLVALTLYTSAFIAEIVRAGILAISKGQSEAAFALGLRPGRTMQLVILPQALRVIIPPLISQYLNITKNTSLGIAVSYLDLRGTLGGISLNQTGRELECMLLMMAIYLTLSLTISTVMNFYNKSVQLKVR